MRQYFATIAIILEERKQRKDDTCPVQLRVTYQGKYKYYGTSYRLTPEQYQKVCGKKPRGEYKEIKQALDSLESKAQDIIGSMTRFSFGEFGVIWDNQERFIPTVYEALQQYITELSKHDQVSTCRAYRCVYNLLREFSSGDKLEYMDITVAYLVSLETYLLDRGTSWATVGAYMRIIRRLFNWAIEKKFIRKDINPFGKGKYMIRNTANIKKALCREDLKKLLDYKPASGTSEAYCYHLWCFSYFGNGMNFKDRLF